MRSLVSSHIKAVLGAAAFALSLPAFAQAPAEAENASDQTARSQVLGEVVVSAARRREEAAQDVPIAISVIDGELLSDAGAFNVSRLQNIVPTVQFYSSNPRNTFVNIRGLGQPFGLTNDGIEPGVGFYVDGVLYARPASTTMDFIDIERVEVLRGPQGTLFGKNTTAGAILVTTRKPRFETGYDAELSYGNYNYTQAKVSLTGPISEKLAGRLSFAGTQRDGTIYNVNTQKYVNDLNNLGLRGQLLYTPSESTDILLAFDYTRQRPEGYAQVLAGVVPTQRVPERQFWQIIEDLNYVPPNADPVTRTVRPFDRVIDTGTPWRSGNTLYGASLNIDTALWGGTLTSTTAWRHWIWDPSNDRDYLALRVGTLSQAPSVHDQWTQEIRWAGDLTPKISGVFGVYAFKQRLKTDPVHSEEVGEDYFRFIWNPSGGPNGTPDASLWGPGGSVVDNYFAGQRSEITSQLDTVSAAIFAQLDWAITDRLHLLPGLRLNYDKKEADFEQRVLNVPELPPGSPTPPAPAYSASTAVRRDTDTNVSGQLTLSFRQNAQLNYYATFATAFKSIGINLGGGPAIQIPPEDVRHFEIGLKSNPTARTTANVAVFNTVTKDFQTQVLIPGNPRPVIASAEEVRVRGVELDGSYLGDLISLYASVAYTDGEYTSFPNAPLPLELTGAPFNSVDATGGRLPGISKWSGSVGAEYDRPARFLGNDGEFFTAFDVFYRDDFSSSATPSQYLNIDGYALVNARLGFRSDTGWTTYLWVRNAFDKDYFELLQAAPAGQGAGHYGAQLGDPRTYGITLRYSF
ncbi:MAG TPA: TonB-dependent receptor [Steroidobacteraceae bacterium]